MMQTGLFKRLLTALGNSFGDLVVFFDNNNLSELLAYIGQPGITLPQAYLDLVSLARTLQQEVTALVAVDKPDYEQLAELARTLVAFVAAIEEAADPSHTAANNAAGNNAALQIDWVAVSEQLAGTLVMSGLRTYLPVAYHWLAVVGVFTGTGNFYTVGDDTYESRGFNLANFKALLSQPTTYLAEYFGWGVDFTFDDTMQADLMSLLAVLGADPTLVNADVYSPPAYDGVVDPTGRGVLYLPFTGKVGAVLNKLLSVSLLAQSTTDPDVEMVEETDPDTGEVTTYPASGPYDQFVVNLLSDAKQADPISIGDHLTLRFADFSKALSFVVGPDGVHFADGAGADLLDLKIDPAAVLAYTPATPLIIIGEPDKTRLQADGLELALALSANQGVKLTLKAVNSQLFIKGSEGDSFLSSVLPDSTIAVPLSVTLSSADGLRFNGANTFRLKTSPNRAIGPVLFKQVTLGLESTATHDVAIRAHSDLVVQLGPVAVSASDVGASFTIKDITSLQGIGLGFDLPKGLGISVDSDAVTGGGYLFIDPDKHQYAGAANLHIKAGAANINVNALGILQTELPGYPDDYSLLLLLTATFTPVQLGLGFTLNGLGGLLGVNRQADVEYLRGMVRQNQLKQLLFADNVAADPAAALTLIDAAFPVARGRYTIGLMAQLGWGSVASVLTLDVALLLELPKPIRVLLLGVLQAVLPNADNEKLKLRADFLGVVDTGAKKISFDAALSGSHILGFTLTGDMAFRLYQGDNPLFVITAGGFHPSFQPPAGAALTGLRRLTLALNKDDLQATLTSYYAVTSNTVQFGARLAVVYQLSHGFHVDGYFGFDVLFQFSPFRLLAHVEAGVAIKRGSREYLSLHLSLDVSGPGPWHIRGSASFHVIFWTISVDVDATIGAAPAEAALPAPDVHQQLLAALRTPTSWEVEAPKTAALPGGVALRPAGTMAGQLFLDPRGALVLRQRVAPLGLALQKFGTAPTTPTNGTYFELTQLKVGDDTYLAGNGALEETRDFFAPDQFRRLTDAERLSSPSFQSLPNGLRLKRLNGLVADPHATRRVVEYEQKLLSGASGGSTQPMQAGTYRQLAQGAALGREVAQAQPSARAAQPVHWGEDTYEVVCADTLHVYDAGHAAFKTQAEAAQYCQALEAADPSLEVLVVPTYQLALA